MREIREAVTSGQIVASANLGADGVLQHADIIPGFQRFFVWVPNLPQVTHDAHVLDEREWQGPAPAQLREKLADLLQNQENEGDVALLINNGSHWFGVVIRVVGRIVEINYMEPMASLNATSLRTLSSFLYPQIEACLIELERRQAATSSSHSLQALAHVDHPNGGHEIARIAPDPPSSNIALLPHQEPIGDLEERRRLIANQDAEFAATLEQDRTALQEGEELGERAQEQLLPDEQLAPEEQLSTQELRRRRVDRFYHQLHHGLQPSPLPPRLRARRPQIDGASIASEDD